MALKRKNLIRLALLSGLLIILTAIVILLSPKDKKNVYTIKRGHFEEIVTCKGEIHSAAQVEIKIPEILRNYQQTRIYDFRLLDLVDDGTELKKGDVVARLDPTDLSTRLRSVSQELEKARADLNNARMDSTVKLNQMREDIADAKLDLEYNKIDIEQSIYESESYQHQVQMNYQKAVIAIEKKKRDYLLERNKTKIGIMRMEQSIAEKQKLADLYSKALSSMVVTSPSDGIIRLANAMSLTQRKLKKSDYVSVSPGLIGVLPNLNTANSEVYVKEIDFSKIAVGDTVRISFDALDGVTLPGKITWISSIGEYNKEYDMKVFKVYIWINGTDPGLKPAMSTTNNIVVNSLDSVLSVPVNAVFSKGNDNYVYLRRGQKTLKQKITIGPENEEEVVVEKGVKVGDQVLTENPETVKTTAEL